MPEWERIIAHVDMDAFYASIEIRDQPALRGKPVVVGGSSSGRGVVSAASYEARKYKVHSALPMAEAERRCPHLVRLPVNFTKYRSVSRQIMEILHSYSPYVEPLSLDEGFLDLTGTRNALGEPAEIGRKIKTQILETTRLTASVGIAPIKFVAKIASDHQKPDGLTVVEPGHVLEFLHPLPLSDLWGVGPRTREILEGMGLRTIGDLASAGRKTLVGRFGLHGEHLYDLSQGTDDRDIVPDWDAKSYSHEQTFARDQADGELLESILLDQSLRVSRRLRRDEVSGRIVQLKIRYHDFSTYTRRITLPGPTADADEIYRVARHLFQRVWSQKAVRLIGVGVSGIQQTGTEMLDLFSSPEKHKKRRKLTATIDQIEERFGHGKVIRAKMLGREKAGGTGTPSMKDTERRRPDQEPDPPE